jgi:hypothetical protein
MSVETRDIPIPNISKPLHDLPKIVQDIDRAISGLEESLIYILQERDRERKRELVTQFCEVLEQVRSGESERDVSSCVNALLSELSKIEREFRNGKLSRYGKATVRAIAFITVMQYIMNKVLQDDDGRAIKNIYILATARHIIDDFLRQVRTTTWTCLPLQAIEQLVRDLINAKAMLDLVSNVYNAMLKAGDVEEGEKEGEGENRQEMPRVI